MRTLHRANALGGSGAGGWFSPVEVKDGLAGRGVGSAIALSVEDKSLGALCEPLCNHLRIEGIGENLRPVLEGAVRGDRRRAAGVIALRDDVKRENGP